MIARVDARVVTGYLGRYAAWYFKTSHLQHDDSGDNAWPLVVNASLVMLRALTVGGVFAVALGMPEAIFTTAARPLLRASAVWEVGKGACSNSGKPSVCLSGK